MNYYREYLEIDNHPDGPYVAEVRLCHDFPDISPTAGNQVVVFDERVVLELADGWWQRDDMPTESWGVIAC